MGSDRVYQNAFHSEDYFGSYRVHRQWQRHWPGRTRLNKPFFRIEKIIKRWNSFKQVGFKLYTVIIPFYMWWRCKNSNSIRISSLDDKNVNLHLLFWWKISYRSWCSKCTVAKKDFSENVLFTAKNNLQYQFDVLNCNIWCEYFYVRRRMQGGKE